MTAVIGILNKQAVAVAADSAVTIGGQNGKKILNKANKIFTLSKTYPVGIALYNSAEFMFTPWEILIKSYRTHLGIKHFPTLDLYYKDFLRFIKEHQHFKDIKLQKQLLFNISYSLFYNLNQEALKGKKHLLENEKHLNEVKQIIENNIEKVYSELPKDYACCEDFDSYSLVDFEKFSNESIKSAIEQTYEKYNIFLNSSTIKYLSEICYVHLRSRDFRQMFTGLIFFGYGEQEIYPSLIPANVSGIFDGRLRFYINEDNQAKITDLSTSSINPFAQTDVINTILTGIAPQLDQFYIQQFGDFLKKYNNMLSDVVKSKYPPIEDTLKRVNISKIVEEYREEMIKIKTNNYIYPLITAVSTLSKDDLSEMAESLIYLTYLKRRITFAEESVGGPVDVAIISKGDGFIWMKRKHYFDPKLNQHFFANYFKT